MTGQWLEVARTLAPVVKAHREALEQERQLPRPIVDAVVEAGLFRLLVPRSQGGPELDLASTLRTIEVVSQLDGAVGWNVMIGLSGGVLAPLVDPASATEIFGDPKTVIAGSFNVRGKTVAVPVEGGYRLTGHWGFGSGCQQATWLGGVCVVMEDGKPRLHAGAPDPHLALFPRAQAEIRDTWKVSGLRGTGSHDYLATDVFVPAGRLFSISRPQQVEAGTLYRYPVPLVLALLPAPVALGIARTAIDALVALAGAKTPVGTQALLRDRVLVQADVARAEALLGSARAYLYETVEASWARVAATGEAPAVRERAGLRLACTHAVESAAKAVDLMYGAGGATSIYETGVMERCFRDVHVATQHALVATQTYEPIGRVLLGLEPNVPRF